MAHAKYKFARERGPHCDRILNRPWISSNKIGFTLAEERMKQKMFFSDSPGSMGLSVWKGFGSHGVSECFFFLQSTIAYPASPTHPSCVIWVARVVIVSSLSFLSAIFSSFVL